MLKLPFFASALLPITAVFPLWLSSCAWAAPGAPPDLPKTANRKTAANTKPFVTMPTSAERTEKRDVLRAALQKNVTDLDARIAQSKDDVTGRDISNGALAHLLLSNGAEAGQAEDLLKRLLAGQNTDPQSPDFGKIPWNIYNDSIQDANAIEFGTQAWGPIVLGYGDKLSPAFKTEFLARFPACFATLRRHDVKVSYTNIFLMKTVCMILMGQASGDEKATNEGYDALDTWLSYTRENGIREFGSPTYYATSMGSLLNGYRWANRPGGREKFKQALDYFWADIGAHYFWGQESLSGPHSRDYDFLLSGGGGTLYMYSEGLRSHDKIVSIDLEKTHLVMNQEPGGYHPGAFLYEIANMPERWVKEKWDIAPDQVRTTYLTPDFALGSTNRTYGPQDKMINLELAGHWPDAKRLPGITIVADDTDLPYGKTKTKDKSGHSKPRHIKLNPVTVQDKGDLLVFTDASSSEARKDAASIATNIILPAKADAITVGASGKDKISTQKPFTRVLSFGDVVGVRAGNAAVAVRVLQSGALGGQTPTLVLQADNDGLKDDALRLSAYQWRGTGPVPTTGDTQVVTLVLAAPCKSDAEYAALMRRAAQAKYTITETGKNEKTVSVQMSGTVLSTVYNTETHLPGASAVDNKPVAPPQLLSVNGKEMGLPLLAPIPAKDVPQR